jgi:hypothetical protein
MSDELMQFSEELTETKVTDKLKKYNSSWDQYSNELYPKMKTYFKMYRNLEATIEGVAAKIPEIFTVIETELPHLLNSVFGPSTVVDATPKFSDPLEEKTYKVTAYINKLIKDICKGRKKTELVIKNMLIYGWAVTKVYWNTDTDRDIDPTTKEVVEVNSAHPDFYMVDPFAFAWNPEYNQQEIDGLDWCRERVFIGKNQLKQKRDNGECGDFSDDDMETVGGDEDKGTEARKGTSSPSSKKGKTYYDEFWCTLYYKDETGKTVSGEYRIWFLSNKKIIKFEKNLYGYKPFTICRAYSQPNEFLGAGESEVIGSISAQLSYNHYQSGKMVKKLGQALTFIDPSAGISAQNLKRIEQGVLFVDNINGIKSEVTTDPQNIEVLIKYGEYLNTMLEKITGVGPTLQGDIATNVTATQISIVNQNASNRLANKLVHIQEDFIVPLADMFFMLNKQLLQIGVEFFDTNNNLISLTPDDFSGNYTWTSVGTISQSNKALQLAQNQELLQGLMGLSESSKQGPFPFDVNEIIYIQQHLVPYANITDASAFIIPSPAPMTMGAQPTSTGTPMGNPIVSPQGLQPVSQSNMAPPSATPGVPNTQIPIQAPDISHMQPLQPTPFAGR